VAESVERDASEGHHVTVDGGGLRNLRAVYESAVAGAEIPHHDAIVVDGHLRVLTRDGGVVDWKVAGHSATDDDRPPNSEVDSLVTSGA